MGMIYGATTMDWPDGLAWLVAQSLNKKYAPKDRISRVEMKRRLTAASMGKKEDPHKMFEEFHRLSNLFNDGNRKISDEDLMARVFLAAPDHVGIAIIDLIPKP
jgi:gag-polypeptide of LTR copia-type